jgi:hypothetical protein
VCSRAERGGQFGRELLLLKGELRASGLIPETQQEASAPVCVCVNVFGCRNG